MTTKQLISAVEDGHYIGGWNKFPSLNALDIYCFDIYGPRYGSVIMSYWNEKRTRFGELIRLKFAEFKEKKGL